LGLKPLVQNLRVLNEFGNKEYLNPPTRPEWAVRRFVPGLRAPRCGTLAPAKV